MKQPDIRWPQPKLAQAALWPPSGRLAPATHTDRSQAIPEDPKNQVSGAFNESDRITADAPSSSEKLSAAHKLDGRMTFRGLPISIETAKGAYRHWTDAATGEAGKTKMLYAYGYIRRTKGLDGDHVDVFVGPNEKAESVYVIMTNKAPDFVMADEGKCMLGFDTQDAAKAGFLQHHGKPGVFSFYSQNVLREVREARLRDLRRHPQKGRRGRRLHASDLLRREGPRPAAGWRHAPHLGGASVSSRSHLGPVRVS